MNKKTSLALLSFLLLIFFTSTVYGIGLGVSPASLHYRNVLKGGYAQDQLAISTDTSDNLTILYELKGSVTDWISFEPSLDDIENVVISADKPLFLQVIVQPPQDIQTGNYTGELKIITQQKPQFESGMGSAIRAAFLIKITVEITGEQIVSCTIGGVELKDSEIDQLTSFFATLNNKGNVRLNPEVTLQVWDQLQENIVHTQRFNLEQTLPTTTKTTERLLDHSLDIGQYWVDIVVGECGYTGLQTFSVLDRGQLSDFGELIRIENPPWALTYDVVPISAVFKNKGDTSVSARFRGTVTYNTRVVEILESDELLVRPKETVRLDDFFEPLAVGQYFISGRVVYNNKLTYEKGAVLNVNLGEKPTNTTLLITLVLVIVILVLLILIRKKKKLS
ncbi:hypothetical protein GOV04_03090 [Candidatus Woesearchaeota archaeon]|nr:hypothetical protein [Candidatus Woesearchaeota archaeon]